MEKTCSQCGLTKPLEEFYRNAHMADGYYNQCKICRKLDLKHKQAHPELVKKYQKYHEDIFGNEIGDRPQYARPNGRPPMPPAERILESQARMEGKNIFFVLGQRSIAGQKEHALTEDAVRFIRRSTTPAHQLAKRFGVHYQTIYSIKKRRTYIWVPDQEELIWGDQ